MTASRRFDTTATSMSSNTTLVSTPHPPEPTSTSTRPCHSDSELDQRLDQRPDLTEREYTQKTRTTNPDVEKGLTPNDEKGWDGLTLPWKRRDGWRGWASDDLSTMALVPSLIVQAFSAGILDATTYADFKTFASNQTGNTILLTVSVLGHVQILLLLTGISLASFLFGALVFGHLGHYMGVKRRSWILTSTTYQITLLIIAAILVSPHGPTSTQIGSKHEWVILLFLANMSGAQVAMARQSGSQELPTAPMTSSFVDLMADRYLFVPFNHPKAGPRNRRLGYILAMVSGGFIGAVVHRFAGSWAVMLVTIFFKLVAMGLVSVAAPEEC